MIFELALLALIALLFYLLVQPLLAAWLFTRPPRLPVAYRTPADWGAEHEDVSLTSSDGATLEGWYLPSRNGAAIILLHGHRGNRMHVAFHAETLSAAGYGVLMIDLRAHGHSGGRLFSRGVQGVDDVLAAVAWLARRRDVQGRLGIMGISAGGMLALQAAARNAYIRTAAADGPILGTIDDLPPPAGLLDRLWHYPRERFYQAAIDRFAPGPRPPANIQALGRMAGRPVLLISTGRGMEQRLTRHFYDAACQPRTLYEIPTAAHATGWIIEPEPYAQTLLDFFSRALSVESDPTARPADQPTINPSGNAQPIGERTVSPAVAMMIAFATIPLAVILLFIPFQLRWGTTPPRLPSGWPVTALLGLFALLLGGLLLRDVVQMIAYRWIGRVPRGATHFAGGQAALGPRVQCDMPVSARAYRAIVLLPGLLLGVLPGIAGVMTGSWLLVVWGLWMIVVSGSAWAALWAMRGLPAHTPVRAHPHRPGCEVLSSNNN